MSLDFEIYFLEFPFKLLKDCNELKNILVFTRLMKMLNFLLDFVPGLDQSY